MKFIIKIIIPLFVFTLLQNKVSFAQSTLHQGQFSKKKYKIKGSYKIIKYENGNRFLILSKDFKTKNGPDLKIFFTSKTVSQSTGKNATKGSFELVKLKSTKAGQRFKIPKSVKLADYKSILIHCEAYSVLWGGATL